MNNLQHLEDPIPSDILHRLEDIYTFKNKINMIFIIARK